MSNQQRRWPKIGLALGGGGAKGLAHIGVLKVLEELEIPISYIAGTSVGAFVGGAYACGIPIEEMIRKVRKMRWSDLGKLAVSRLGLRDGSRMEAYIRTHFRATTFEALRIPLAVVAADIMSGAKVVIRHGDLARAIRASTAIPGYFTPVPYEGNQLLVDGGIVDCLPVSVVKSMGAERVIAVDVHPFSRLEQPPTNLYQIYSQAYAIVGYNSGNQARQMADLLVAPNLSHVAWDDLSRADEIIRIGEETMRRLAHRCQQWLKQEEAGLFARWRLAWTHRDPETS
ncbi:MAG: patatin-like phospholipase family protein [Acidobacteriota bacterium]|nr:patatin-like phospholipase family protein [Blastocatellia bacterium]MDW8240051.1 patatin-like phospholipase family protein [Acidobacteriota bacterium]